MFDGDFLTSGKILMTSSQAPNNLFPVHEANSALAVPLASTVDVASFNLMKDCAYPNSFKLVSPLATPLTSSCNVIPFDDEDDLVSQPSAVNSDKITPPQCCLCLAPRPA